MFVFKIAYERDPEVVEFQSAYYESIKIIAKLDNKLYNSVYQKIRPITHIYRRGCKVYFLALLEVIETIATYDGVSEIVPPSIVITQPSTSPLTSSHKRRPVNHYPPLTCGLLDSPATQTHCKYK